MKLGTLMLLLHLSIFKEHLTAADTGNNFGLGDHPRRRLCQAWVAGGYLLQQQYSEYYPAHACGPPAEFLAMWRRITNLCAVIMLTTVSAHGLSPSNVKFKCPPGLKLKSDVTHFTWDNNQTEFFCINALGKKTDGVRREIQW
jgi:hypothetical protein